MRQLKIIKQVTNRESKSLDKYLQDISKIDLITAQEEVELAQKIRAGDQAALEKLTKLRCRVRRFKTLGQTLKKLFTPNIEKALTFLDDSQLPSTSNAVERGYRRHRKMQKSVYRVRTQEHISQRIAIDMQREEQSRGRLQTIQILHNVRNGTECSR